MLDLERVERVVLVEDYTRTAAEQAIGGEPKFCDGCVSNLLARLVANLVIKGEDGPKGETCH